MIDIIWAPAADRDLGRVKLYLDQVGQSASRRLFRKVLDAVELLESAPEMGTPIQGLEPPNLYRRVLVDHFALVYRWDPPVIRILRFWDARQDPDSFGLLDDEQVNRAQALTGGLPRRE